MATVYTGDTLYFILNADETPIYQGPRTLRVRTDVETFPVGDNSADLPVVVEDLATGAVLEVEYVDAVEISFSQAGMQRTGVFFTVFEDGDGDGPGYILLAEGDPVPEPPVGADLEDFLAELGASLREVIDIPGSGFSEGTQIDFDDVAGLTRLGETGQGLPEARAERIALIYEAGLDRDGNVDTPGLNFWIDAAEGGFSDRRIAAAFLQSAEFEAAFGDPDDLDDFAFVTVLYQNVLDRTADDAGRDFWLSVLARPAVDREALLLAFADSAENRAASAFVETLTEVEPGLWDFA